MGHAFGVPLPHDAIAPFCNLPKEALVSLWLSYNLLGEAWGLDITSFRCIFSGAAYVVEMKFPPSQIDALFDAFDTDGNGLVDALEVLIALCLVSGMDTIEKVHFAFSTYDFGAVGTLTIDETTLLLRSAAKGLAKLCPLQVPAFLASGDAEAYAMLIFQSSGVELTSKISAKQFQLYCSAHPVICSWLKFCAALPLPAPPTPQLGEEDADLRLPDLKSLPPSASRASRFADEAEAVLNEEPLVLQEDDAQEAELGAIVASGEGDAAISAEIVPEGGAEAPVTEAAPPSAEEAAAAGGEEGGEAVDVQVRTRSIKSYVTPWTSIVAHMEPDEMPSQRTDAPEDVLEPVWVHGFSAAAGVRGTATYSNDGQVLFTASRYAVKMSKSTVEGEDAGSGSWSQRLLADHQYPITCMDVNGRLLATGDRITPEAKAINGSSGASDTARVVLWDTDKGSVIGSIPVGSDMGSGVRVLDFSKDGKLLLALSAHESNTVSIYEVSTLALVHASSLVDIPSIFDVRFAGTSSYFAVASSAGVSFFVDECSSFLTSGLLSYEKREGLFQRNGREAVGVAATVLSKFDQPDEMISGTIAGQILFWHGRSCLQMLACHIGAVTCLSYSTETKVLVSGGRDGAFKLFKVGANPAATLTQSAMKQGPQMRYARQIEMIASFDMMHIMIPSRKVCSLCLHKSGEKMLVGTASGDLIELSLIAALPEGASEEPPPPVEVPEGEEAPVSTWTPPVPRLGNDVNGGPIISSHWKGAAAGAGKPMVWGLCKAAGGFVSCGSDGNVRLWQAAEGVPQKMIKQMTCDSGCRSVTVSAENVAVSLDGSFLENRLGTIQIYSFPDFSFVASFNDASQLVGTLRFSPDGSQLVGAGTGSDCNLYVYTKASKEEGAPPEWGLKGKIPTSAGTLSLDFSADGLFLRVCDAKDVLIFYDVGANFRNQVLEKEILKSMTFASFTCPCSWDSRGAFNGLVSRPTKEERGPGLVEQLGSVDRSQHLLVSSGTTGIITLTRLPCYSEVEEKEEVGKSFVTAHCGNVSALLFIEEGARLVTAGADDGIIQVWKVAYDTEEPEPDVPDAADEEAIPPVEGDLDKLYDSAEDEDLLDGDRMLAHLTKRVRTEEKLSAIATWAPSLDYTPANLEDIHKEGSPNTLTPSDELFLDWVHGYSARSTRSAVRFAADGRIVYPAATMGVLLDKMNNKQSYCMAHHDEITCLDVHLSLGLAATSHKGSGNIIASIWSTSTCEVFQKLDCGRVGGVSAIAFNPSGKYLAVACQDLDHSIKIFDWKNNVLKSSVFGGIRKVLSLAFSLAPQSNPDTFRLLQGGESHFKLLDLKNGRSLVSKTGGYGAGVKKSNVLCVGALPLPAEGGNEFVIGLANGSLAVISRNERKISNIFPIISGGALNVLWVVTIKEATGEEPPQFKVVVGGMNGTIKVLDGEFQPVADFNLYVKANYGLYDQGRSVGFKSICVDKANRKILYGTSAGEIGEIDFETGVDMNTGPLVNAHFKDQLFALQAHPLRQECLTAGDDKTLRVWNLETKKLMGVVALPDIARAAAFAPSGQIIVAGLGGAVRGGKGRPVPRDFDGKVVIISFLQGVLRIVHIASDAVEAITSIIFSPQGEKLYVASLDTNIYVYDPLDNFKLVNTLKVHSEGILTLDLSTDGTRMCSTGINGEMLFWDTDTYANVTPDFEQLDALTWSIRQGARGRNSLGVFAPYSKANEITSLSQSSDNKLLATGDAYGTIRLFRNPARKVGAPCKKFKGHSAGGVSKVAFSVNDAYLLSLGREDRTLLQWRVSKSKTTPDPYPELPPVVDAAEVDTPLGVFADSFFVQGVDVLSVVGLNQENEQTAISPPSSTIFCGVGNLQVTADPFMQLARPIGKYCGLGSVVTVCGKRVVSLHADRLSQLAWEHIGAQSEVGALAVSANSRFVLVGTAPQFQIPTTSAERNSFLGTLSMLDAATGVAISILAEDLTGGVKALAFSHDSSVVTCLGGDERHLLYVYRSRSGLWTDAELFFTGESSAGNAFLVSFVTSSSFDFAIAGDCSLTFWTIAGRNVSFVAAERGAPIVSLVGLPSTGQLIAGDTSGNIKCWMSANQFSDVGAHAGAVSALAFFPTLPGFVSGAIDSVKVWTSSGGEFYTTHEFPILQLAKSLANFGSLSDLGANGSLFVSCLSTDATGKRLVVSLSCNALLEVAVDSAVVLVLAEGELKVTTNCAVAHPSEPFTMASCYSNGVVKVWDLSYASREVVSVATLGHVPTSLLFVSDKSLVVGVHGGDTAGKSGALVFVDLAPPEAEAASSSFQGRRLRGTYRTMTVVNKLHNVGFGAVTNLRMTPDGLYLVAGSADGSLHLFSFAAGGATFAAVGSLKVHPGTPIAGFDFSICSRYLRTFGPCDAGDNLVKVTFFDFDKGEDEGTTEGVARNVKDASLIKRLLTTATWASISSPAAHEARGVHPAAVAGVGTPAGEVAPLTSLHLPRVTDVSSSTNGLVAAGFSDGVVRIFKTPAIAEGALVLDAVHSSGPVKLVFLSNNQLCTLGEQDGVVSVFTL